MPPLEPKPTTYKGVKYRSRLEARWAVYLHQHPAISNIYYEPCTYGHPLARDAYTPDFGFRFQPDFEIILEVKPSTPTPEYLKRLVRIGNEFSISNLLLAVGGFYQDEEPIIWHLSQPGCVISAGRKLRNSQLYNPRALAAASGYRFDLLHPEGKPYVRKKRRRRS